MSVTHAFSSKCRGVHTRKLINVEIWNSWPRQVAPLIVVYALVLRDMTSFNCIQLNWCVNFRPSSSRRWTLSSCSTASTPNQLNSRFELQLASGSNKYGVRMFSSLATDSHAARSMLICERKSCTRLIVMLLMTHNIVTRKLLIVRHSLLAAMFTKHNSSIGNPFRFKSSISGDSLFRGIKPFIGANMQHICSFISIRIPF